MKTEQEYLRATGNSGRDFVVLPYVARAATDMLLRLINRWNGSLAVDWRYSTSL